MDEFDEAGRRRAGPGIGTDATAARPPLYKVLMLDDDYTPVDFVIGTIATCFGKDRDEAAEIMLNIRRSGIGLCGVYTYDVAETRMMRVVDLARQHDHPLQCRIERA